jgi:hypothetical protein
MLSFQSLVPYCWTLWGEIRHQIRGETQAQHGMTLKKTLLYAQVCMLVPKMHLQVYHSANIRCWLIELTYGAFTLDVKSMLNENLGGILGGTQC